MIPYKQIEVPAGATAGRPQNPRVGETYFDQTLGLPIWWNGATWVNALGVPV